MTLWAQRADKLGARIDALALRPGMTYVLALGLVTVMFALISLFGEAFSSQQLYLFFVPPVLVAGIVGGWGPGLLATALGLALHLYSSGEYARMIDVRSATFAVDIARAATFFALGIGISWFGERLKASISRAHASALDVRKSTLLRWR